MSKGREGQIRKDLSRTTASALLIFTRNPEPGKCKTRLAAAIGDRAALAVYRFLVRHTASIAGELPEVDKFVYFTDRPDDGALWDPTLFRYRLQEGRDLGERMRNAFEAAFRLGYQRVILIGSDLHDLDTEDLRTAFGQLGRHEAVIGPAADGGYYLLGLTRPNPRLFTGKAWSTEQVLSQTLEDLEGADIHLLPVRNDVDHYEDIQGNPIFEDIINQSRNE